MDLVPEKTASGFQNLTECLFDLLTTAGVDVLVRYAIASIARLNNAYGCIEVEYVPVPVRFPWLPLSCVCSSDEINLSTDALFLLTGGGLKFCQESIACVWRLKRGRVFDQGFYFISALADVLDQNCFCFLLVFWSDQLSMCVQAAQENIKGRLRLHWDKLSCCTSDSVYPGRSVEDSISNEHRDRRG